MSDKTAEISASVKAASGELSDLATRTEQIAQEAREKYESAAMHGWHGVAANVFGAIEHLEVVVAQVQEAHGSCESTCTTLDEISDKMSSEDVAAHLVTALGTIDTATTSLQGSSENVSQAADACLAAGVEYLAGWISGLGDELVAVMERVAQSRADIDAERTSAQAYADEAHAKREAPSPGN